MKKTIAILLLLALLLTGCAAEQELDDTAIRADAQLLLESFASRDYELCRAVVRQEVSDADLQGIFDAICGELEELGAYEMTKVSWNRKEIDGYDVITVQYLIEAEHEKFYLAAAQEPGQSGLIGFQVSEAAPDAEPVADRGPAHWAIIAFGGVVVGFVVWMIVDCARRKMKRKWLWLPLILLGTLVLTLTMRGGHVSLNFTIGLSLGVTNLTTYARGGFKLMLYVPVGAIVYFFKRKELTASAPSAGTTQVDEP